MMQNTMITAQQLQVRQPARQQGRTGKGLMAQEGEMTDPFLQIIMNMIAQNPELSANQEILLQTGVGETAGLLETQTQSLPTLDLLGLFQPAPLSQAQDSVQQALTETQSETQALSLEETLAQALKTLDESEALDTDIRPVLPENQQILSKTVRQAGQSTVTSSQAEQSGELTANKDSSLKIQAASVSQRPPQEADTGESGRETKAQSAKQTGSKPSIKEEKAEELDVDALQSRVSQSKVSSPFELKLKTAENSTELELKDQISDGIKHNVSLGKSEFVLKLKPENLGEITVKLIEEAGKTSVTISTLNSQTARLINSELQALKAAVAPMNVEVSEAVVQTQPAYTQGFDMASQQFAQQQFGNGQFQESRGGSGAIAAGISGDEGQESFAEGSYTVYAGAVSSKRLDAYV